MCVVVPCLLVAPYANAMDTANSSFRDPDVVGRTEKSEHSRVKLALPSVVCRVYCACRL
ncbi:hypothetical protein PF010_g27993 [Phytophthora fragariae]|uniref:RxLR effector protein n=1 Tax=Phytophthora fragariae TaxID=53985 RepID=A0A6G0ML05_9STRA|nr:hypothetical protein PF010_g27993 [Phytophthora fragariae]KAE9171491.1 hypothetical protein PF004_g27544 [Phytophthora fragariae]